MKNKRFVMAGIIVILIVGIVSVFATQDKSWFGHKGWKKHHYKNFGDKSAWLDKMGLPADATKAQIIEAKKELWGEKAGYKENKFHSKKKDFGFHKGLCGKS